MKNESQRSIQRFHTLAANKEGNVSSCPCVSIDLIQKSLDFTSRDMDRGGSSLQYKIYGTIITSEIISSVGSAFNALVNNSPTCKVSIESACHPNITISPSHEERHEVRQLPKENFNVMKSYCVQQRATQLQRQSLTVLVPEGTIGVSQKSNDDGTIVKGILKPSVLGNRLATGLVLETKYF